MYIFFFLLYTLSSLNWKNEIYKNYKHVVYFFTLIGNFFFFFNIVIVYSLIFKKTKNLFIDKRIIYDFISLSVVNRPSTYGFVFSFLLTNGLCASFNLEKKKKKKRSIVVFFFYPNDNEYRNKNFIIKRITSRIKKLIRFDRQ